MCPVLSVATQSLIVGQVTAIIAAGLPPMLRVLSTRVMCHALGGPVGSVVVAI
jgi:hypothetical protein